MFDYKMKLEVGMKIYAINHRRINSVYTVTRVTRTQAILDDDIVRLRIEADDYGYCQRIGASTWNSTSYYVETDSLKARLADQKVHDAFKNVDGSKLTIDQKRRILAIANEPKEQIENLDAMTGNSD